VRERRTASFRSKRTTRPPLSPVARKLPVESNSTVEMISAADEDLNQLERMTARRKTEGGRWKGREGTVPSVISSISPLSPKHWANRQPPEPDGSSILEIVVDDVR
jgi:hypothetical protein